MLTTGIFVVERKRTKPQAKTNLQQKKSSEMMGTNNRIFSVTTNLKSGSFTEV